MDTFSTCILKRVTLSDGDAMDLSMALDLLAFHELDIVVQVHEAAEGDTPRLLVEHAPANEEGSYLDFPTPISIDLSVVGSTWHRVTSFTRWVTWRTTGTMGAGPVVTMDILARR